MTEPEKDREENQNEDDQFVASWVFSLVPRGEIARADPTDGQPLIEAQWSDRPVHVVPEEVIADWASSQVAAVRTAVEESDVELSICAIDLAATLDEAELTGETSDNVLVVENSSGAQIGTDNRQLNIHHFTAKRVQICLDKALANHLAADVATSSPSHQSTVGTLDGFDKVIIRNSRGVQIGDHNSQRNVFSHVVTRLKMPLTDLFNERRLDGIVDKLRDRRIGSVQAEITTVLRQAFKRDASELFAALPEAYNISSHGIPQCIANKPGAQFGFDNTQEVIERIRRVTVDRSTLKELADILPPPPPTAQPARPATPEPPATLSDDRPVFLGWHGALGAPSYDTTLPETPSSASEQNDLPSFDSPGSMEEPGKSNPDRGISGPGSFW